MRGTFLISRHEGSLRVRENAAEVIDQLGQEPSAIAFARLHVTRPTGEREEWIALDDIAGIFVDQESRGPTETVAAATRVYLDSPEGFFAVLEPIDALRAAIIESATGQLLSQRIVEATPTHARGRLHIVADHVRALAAAPESV